MDLQALKLVNDERAIAVIRSFLHLNEFDAFRPNAGTLAVALLEDAGKRIAAAVARIRELEAENAGIELDRLTAPSEQDGLRIVRAERDADTSFQEYHAMLTAGGKQHFYAVRVVKLINADGPDARPADHFAAIERRLLAGNPAEAL